MDYGLMSYTLIVLGVIVIGSILLGAGIIFSRWGLKDLTGDGRGWKYAYRALIVSMSLITAGLSLLLITVAPSDIYWPNIPLYSFGAALFTHFIMLGAIEIEK